MNVILPENRSKQDRLVKILVEIVLNKPLLRGTKIILDGEQEWIEFKYELLPSLCFYCGLIGNQEKSCEKKVEDSQNDQVREKQYGTWLRASTARGVKSLELLAREEAGNKGNRVK